MFTPYLFVSSSLKILLPNQGLFYYMKPRVHFFLKKEQHKIKKVKISEKLDKNSESHTKKGKNLTLLAKNINLGANIEPKKGLIGPANRI